MDLQNILNDEIAKAQGKSIAPSPKEMIKSQKEQEKAANKTTSTNPLAGVAAAVGTGAVEGVKSAASNASTMQSINTLKQEIGEIESARTRVQKAGTYTADVAQQMDEQIALRKARIANLIETQKNKNAVSNAKLQATDERYELGRVGEFMQDLGSAAGNMAPSLGIGLINPLAGVAAFGMQSAAQGYGQALDEGATHEQAARYGVATGVKEAAIEKLTGGLGRFYGRGLIGNTLKNNSLKNVAINTLKGAAGEGAEEALSGAIDPYLQRATYNPEAENATAEELAYQAAIGAALGSILGGSSNVFDYGVSRNAAKTQQNAAQQAQTQSTINNTVEQNDGLKGKLEPSISPNNGTIQEQETSTTPQNSDIPNDNIYAEAYEEMVTGKGAAAQQALTEDEKNVKRFIQSAAVNARLEVKYDDLPTSRRAYYADGVLHINKNKLNEGMKVTAAHEIYHALEGTKEHDAVVELAIKAQGGDTQSLIAQKIAEYAKAGITLDEAGARAEIGAAFIEKAMSDEATINQVLLENRTLAQRILQWIKDMLSVFEKRKTMSAADLTEYKALLKARKQYEQGLAKLREGKYEPAGVERNARYKVDANLRQQFDDWLYGKMPYNGAFDLGKTPDILKKYGAQDLPLVMTQEVMAKITGMKHTVSLDELAKLPDQIANPIMLFKGSVPNSFTVVTEITDKEGNDVLAAIHLNKRQERLYVNNVASVYGKENMINYVKKNIDSGKLLFADAKKAPMWFTTRGLQLPKVVQTIIDANNIIRNSVEKVNSNLAENEKNFFTGQIFPRHRQPL